MAPVVQGGVMYVFESDYYTFRIADKKLAQRVEGIRKSVQTAFALFCQDPSSRTVPRIQPLMDRMVDFFEEESNKVLRLCRTLFI